jgi:thiol-disulfide isomerase/thioredoxin
VPAAKALAKQVQRGRTRPQVEAFYKARFAADQVKNITLEDSPSKGNPGAPVLLVEFADFQCPACRAVRPMVEEALKKHDGQTRLVFKNFPLSIHQHGEKLARSARAAQLQGKFWEMYAALFDNQERISPEVVDELAKGLGLDMAKFAKDLQSEAVADSVSRDRKQGETLDIQSTPTLYINGRPFPSTPDFAEDLEDWINLEIELTTGVAAPAAAPPVAAPPVAAPPATPSAAKSAAAPAPSLAAPAPGAAPAASVTKKP